VFAGEQRNDLPFTRGEVLTIIDACNVMYWYVAEKNSGQRGVIPITHVKVSSAHTYTSRNSDIYIPIPLFLVFYSPSSIPLPTSSYFYFPSSIPSLLFPVFYFPSSILLPSIPSPLLPTISISLPLFYFLLSSHPSFFVSLVHPSFYILRMSPCLLGLTVLGWLEFVYLYKIIKDKE